MVNIQIHRIYDDNAPQGYRALVDRLWPRGVSKEDADLDGRWKGLAPSNDLRKWFSHDPDKWGDFRKKFLSELSKIKDRAKEHTEEVHQKNLILLYGTKEKAQPRSCLERILGKAGLRFLTMTTLNRLAGWFLYGKRYPRKRDPAMHSLWDCNKVNSMKSTDTGSDYMEEEFTAEQIGEMPGETLLEFGTPWCGHCQAASSAINEVVNEQPELRHIKIYDGKGKPLGRAFKVKLWPTLILLHEGNEVARVVRPLVSDEVRQLFSTFN